VNRREDIVDEDNNVTEWCAAVARRGEKALQGHRTAAVILHDIPNTVHPVVERWRRRSTTGMVAAVAVAADVALGCHHQHHVGPHDHSPIIRH
jgi:hypothetical protein